MFLRLYAVCGAERGIHIALIKYRFTRIGLPATTMRVAGRVATIWFSRFARDFRKKISQTRLEVSSFPEANQMLK